MKKRVFGRKLSRGRGARGALMRSMVSALVANGSIVTTKGKAKFIQNETDKVINLAKIGSVDSRRRLRAWFANDRKSTDGVIEIVKSHFINRAGGYTRLVNLPTRRGDAAEMVRLEWVEQITKTEAKPSDKKAKKQKEVTKKKKDDKKERAKKDKK